jgi:hypothetical protein
MMKRMSRRSLQVPLQLAFAVFEHAAGFAHRLVRQSAAAEQEGHERDSGDEAQEGFACFHHS